MTTAHSPSGIAIVGLACRVPGARNVDEFWANVCGGVESIRRLTDEEMLEAGLDAEDLLDPHHIAAGALVDDVDRFDAAFFGITSREAELMDPQQRLFLECAWSALEHAGYDPSRIEDAVGVFGGANFDSYLTRNLLPANVFEDKAAVLQAILANDKDYLATRVAYKLNLRGPAYTVQSGCSTSLVAVHLGSQSLLNFECDLALAGGVAIDVGRQQGYWSHEGSVFSPDGHCRAFDASAQGTVFGNGCAMVVLKRLEDAVRDGDTIYATILGSAINNDGSVKVGFTAPSIGGQAAVIAEALSDAGVPAHSIGYVETHGTATPLGDPIEVEALARAFGTRPAGYARCAIGSVKTNVGHLDSAAGAIGLIKAALALHHGVIPPSLNFSSPNPAIAFDRTPFYVNTQLSTWTDGTRSGWPRRAGVSSFGMGGTNAHIVLEAPAPAQHRADSTSVELLVWSARTPGALERATANLLTHLEANPSARLADVAHTLQSGRSVFAHRRTLACQSVDDAMSELRRGDASPRIRTHHHAGDVRPVAFMFPGHGSQYVGMARELYETEPIVREQIDACASDVLAETGVDLHALLLESLRDPRSGLSLALSDAVAVQCALFAVEYALAALWRSWGIEPAAVIGHGVGEYAAAAVAGVFSREAALRLVIRRAQLIGQLPPGAMTVVAAAPETLVLDSGLALAAVNGPALAVVSGTVADVERFEAQLAGDGREFRRLSSTRALQSPMIDGIIPAFTDAFAGVRLAPPSIPLVSNVTGRWLEHDEATNPYYWGEHLRRTVRFGDGLALLAASGPYHLVEVGPGRTLATAARPQYNDLGIQVVSSLPASGESIAADVVIADALGQLWQRGVLVDWQAVHRDRSRRRVPLPTYPFERTRFWVEPPDDEDDEPLPHESASLKVPNPAEWLYVPQWKQVPPLQRTGAVDMAAVDWLVFGDEDPFVTEVVARLSMAATPQRVVVAARGDGFERKSSHRYTVNTGKSSDYVSLFEALARDSFRPRVVLHLWGACDANGDTADSIKRAQSSGFYSLIGIMQAVDATQPSERLSLRFVTRDAHDVLGTEDLSVASAPLGAVARVIAQERANVDCACLDVESGSLATAEGRRATVERFLRELDRELTEPLVAYRGSRRWVQTFEPTRLPRRPRQSSGLRNRGVYAIVGGLGRIGLSLANHLASTIGARLILIGRSGLPDRATWGEWLATHGPLDPTSNRIRKVQALGADSDVLVVGGDASSTGDLEAAFAEGERRFGHIDGVISAAGFVDAGSFRAIESLTRDACERQFLPKLDGLFALAQVLADRSPDFCLVVSSLSSVLGGLGYGAYASANAFMDTFVRRRNRRGGVRWLSVNWDAWRWTEFGEDTPAAAMARLAMTPDEAAEVFDRVIAATDVEQVVVSTSSLKARLTLWVEQVGARAPIVESSPDDGTAADTTALEAAPEAAAVAARVDEPTLTATERVVVDAWRSVLGVSRILSHETFLDAGGNSLMAVQAISAIERALGVRIAIEEFIFQTATQLASLCDQKLAARPVAEPAVATGDAPRGLFRSLRTALTGRT